ncbi:MAG: dockerin type I repeat-containing protein, partial [bacterium]|nr:dockerin type I repeat-containing protein [bacterium]
TRAMYVGSDGSRTESITAYGKYWNFNSANGWAPMDGNGSDLTSVARYANILPMVIDTPTPAPTNPPVGSTLMVPRLMASIIFEAKKQGNADIQFTDGSQILRNSDGINIISAKTGTTVSIISAPVSAPITDNELGQVSCTNIAAALPLGKLPSGEDVYIVTGARTVQLGVNASPLAKITWKPAAGTTFSSLNSNPSTLTALSNGSFEIGASAAWDNPTVTANCPNVTISFQSAGQPTPTPSPAAAQNLRHDGDINGDGKINLVDMSRLLAQFGQAIQSETDLKSDGIVNTIDIILLRNILIKNGVLNKP